MLNTVLEEMNSNTNAKIALKSNKRSHRLLFSGSRTKQDYDAIDNQIEQALDLVKSHLMNAVQSEVEELKGKFSN